MVRATSSEKLTLTQVAMAKHLKNWPTTPGMKPVGANTATRVAVVAMTARPISSAASIAAG